MTPTGRGGFTETLAPLGTAIAAEVLAVSGSEAVRDQVLRGVRVYTVTIRWRGDVLTSDKLIWNGDPDPLNIRSAIDPDGRRRELLISADTDK